MSHLTVNNLVIMTKTISQTNINFVDVHDENKLLDFVDPMPDWGYIVTAIALAAIGFFGFTLNLFVIVLMSKDIQIWTPMNIILFNLVCSDFSVSIIGNPFTLASAVNHGWMFGETVCVAYGFFMSLLGITSITTLTVLSYERYCLVSCPFSSTHLTNRGAKIVVGLIWLYSFLVTSPPLFGWGQYVSEAAGISCSVNWESQSLNAKTYIMYLFFFGLFLPVNVITYSYVKIIMTMRENTLRSGRVNKLERRVTAMILVMIIAFLIAWAPYSIFALSEQFGDPELITPSVAVLPALIAKSSICYNPMIYVGMNSQFRAALRRVLGREKVQPNINETTVNQLSESSSSRGYIECSFTNFDKRKKQKLKSGQKHNLINLNTMKINTIDESLNENNNVTNTVNTEAFKSPTIVDSEIKYPETRSFVFAQSVNANENRFELRMFSSEANIYGKAINQIIRANSYKSNIC